MDVLIGTHRLLSRDVRGKDLGLMIVDEEQRFGVKQKELLRQLKLKVDVLSLSATPIPRTLQMSLAGLRDISVIETPPEGRRPVRTHVGPYDEDLVKRAIVREKEREGQVFFLHNRIDTLHETAERLRALCPGVRFAEAHGQMDELQLEATMLAFVRGEHDVLVATTIIESGLDIPTANTLLVERADQLGLAQAYQIRGRVGRSRERAFAYLLYPSAESLTPDAAARLATLSDNTELGSGFRVAMRDLEIRGAGNLLGDEQSGHVAAVGFELYCQMLEDAAEQLRAGAAELPKRSRESRCGSTSTSTPTSPRTTSPSRRRRSMSTAASPPPGSRGSCGRCGRSSRTASGPCPARSPTCSTCSGSESCSARRARAASSFAPDACAIFPVELDSDRVTVLNERLPEAIYQWRERTIAVPVPDDPTARLGALIGVAEGLSAALAARSPAEAEALRTDLGVCGYAAASVSRGFFSKRNLAIIFGAALVLTVAITAAAVGVGHPSVPSDDVAVIDDASIDVPGLVQDGHISKTNFNRFLLQTAKQNNLQQVPQPSDPQYKQLKDQAMQSALQIGWIVGEANKEGLTFTDTQIQQSLQQIKSQFKSQQEYETARDQAGLTEADVVQRARLQLIQKQDPGEHLEQHRIGLRQRRQGLLRREQAAVHAAGQADDPDHPEQGRERRSTRRCRRSGPIPHRRTGRRSPPSTRPIRPRRTRAACAPTSCPAPSSSPSTTRSSMPPPARSRGRSRLRPPPSPSRSSPRRPSTSRASTTRPAAPPAAPPRRSATRSRLRSRASSSRRLSRPSASTSATTGPI